MLNALWPGPVGGVDPEGGLHCRDGSVQHQWGVAEPWALHGIVGLLLYRENLYLLSANAQLYRVPVAGGRPSPPVSLKVRTW